MTFDQKNSSGDRLYVFLTKEYRVGYDCKEKKTEFILFEFVSGKKSKKKFYKFIDDFISGLHAKEWKTAYFREHSRGHYNNKTNSDGYVEKQLSPNFYYYLKNAPSSSVYFSKMSVPPDGIKIEVRVEQRHNKHEKNSTVFYLGDVEEFSKVWNYGKKRKKYGKLISDKIDLRLYRSKKFKTRKDCTFY